MKIAIVKLSALGDIVHAMVALQFIKHHDPTIKIDWIVEERFAPILQDNPDINQILTVNLKALKHHKGAIWQEIKKVKRYARHHYDLVIDAQGLLKSAITAMFLGKKLAGFDQNSIRETLASYCYHIKVHSPYETNTIDRNAHILSEPLGFSITSQQIHQKKAFLYFKEPKDIFAHYLKKQGKNILFVIGSTWESRNYPKEKFLQVANQLQHNVLITWGNELEKEKAEWIAARSDYAQVLPRLNLNDLKALIAQMDLTLGNDTGPAHLAWALNKPSIILFGCTPVSRVYQTEINKVIKSDSIVNPYKLNKHDYSIQTINVNDIVTLCHRLIKIKLSS
ncbi:MAG: lipopolysaccharide heptosyltransferase I [Methylococcales bacterium]|nr:lipopolysaccharide heptosyltransferase I [Methylococcales bacterium]